MNGRNSSSVLVRGDVPRGAVYQSALDWGSCRCGIQEILFFAKPFARASIYAEIISPTTSRKRAIMSKSKGYAAMSPKAPLAPYSFERREPREHDVVIDIKYCGICHSDIHQTRDEWSDYQEESIFPMVPGHEIAGVVTAVGSKVTKHKIGDKVGVGCFVDSCRTCAECKTRPRAILQRADHLDLQRTR